MYIYTSYFEKDVMLKRPYLKKKWCEEVLDSPEYFIQQADGRFRFWKRIKEYGDRYLRVVTLEDKVTIHNAFFDRRFKGGV